MIKKYRKRMLILTGLLLVTVLLAGVSYAVFNSYASQNSINTLAATCIELEFSGEDSVNLTNVYPISDSEGLKTTPYKFKIKNKCKNYLEYIVIASVINVTNPLDSKYVKVNLSGDNEMNSVALSSLKSIQTPASLSGYSIKENYVLKDGDGILKDEERNFEFRMWLDGENSETWTSEQVESKNYQVKISVIGTVKTEPKDDLYIAALIDGEESLTFPTTKNYTATVNCTREGKKIDASESINWTGSKWALTTTITDGNTRCNVEFESLPTWDNPGTGTLLAAIKRDNENASTNTFDSSEDDYGTSYYFKNVVSNNYVEYVNMCWRIVRVVGNGAIKIILHNYNGLTDSNMTPSSSTPCNVTADDLAFARYEGDTYMTSFNTSSDDNAYVGFMYGTAGSNNFTATHLNTNPSTILSNLNKWYINVFSKQAGYNGNQLADTIWCNDKTATSYGYGQNDSTYLTKYRLTVSDDHPTAAPTFKCSNDPSGGRLSIFTFEDTTFGNRALRNYSKLGLLTADEAVLAGTPYLGSSVHPRLYLGENTKSWWWLMSPYDFSSGSAYNYGILGGPPNEVYNKMSCSKVTTNGGLRPALSLVSKIKISTGDGTNTNPYKIVME